MRTSRRRLPAAFAILLLVAAPALADEPERHLEQAEAAYDAGSVQAARAWLESTPGLVSVIPAISPLSRDERAAIFLDIAVCHLAESDTASARLAVEAATSLSNRREGRLHHPDLESFRKDVVRNMRRARASGRSRWGAFQRSLVIPGWGQIYRGHRKKGMVLMGVGLGATALWAVKYMAFRSARSDYEATTRADVLSGGIYQGDSGPYSEYEARHRIADSRASTANKLLGVAIGIWAYNLVDSIVVGPGFFAFRFDLPN